MTTATATPSTLISATDYAAVIGTTLRAIFSCSSKVSKMPISSSLTPSVLNDIGLNHSQVMALEFA